MSEHGTAMFEGMLDLARLKNEPLHPDLVEHTEETSLGLMIKHPLVYDLLPISGLANQNYARKKERLAEAIEDEDWQTVVFLHERPYRLNALVDYVLGRNDLTWQPLSVKTATAEVRGLTAEVWTDSENIHQYVADWLAITEGHEPGDPLLFGDQAEFDKLATDDHGRIEVWRGDCNDGGWSWTTEREVALFFCKRWGENNDLLHGYVAKRHVFGYLLSRFESEVMVRREYVQDVSRTPYHHVSRNQE